MHAHGLYALTPLSAYTRTDTHRHTPVYTLTPLSAYTHTDTHKQHRTLSLYTHAHTHTHTDTDADADIDIDTHSMVPDQVLAWEPLGSAQGS